MGVLIREFQSPDDEMKKIVLKVVKQCCGTDGVDAAYIREEILPHFFQHFWNVRMSLDRRNYAQLVETTVELANKVGAPEMISRLVPDLNDENEGYRKMVVEAIDKVRRIHPDRGREREREAEREREREKERETHTHTHSLTHTHTHTARLTRS